MNTHPEWIYTHTQTVTKLPCLNECGLFSLLIDKNLNTQVEIFGNTTEIMLMLTKVKDAIFSDTCGLNSPRGENPSRCSASRGATTAEFHLEEMLAGNFHSWT